MGKDVAAVREAFHDRLGQMARELGASSTPTASPGAPSSRNSRPSPAPWAMRWAGSSSRSTSGGKPRTGPSRSGANAPSAGGGPPARHRTSPGWSPPPGGTSPGPNASGTAPAVGGLFFPQDQALGLDGTGFSPRVQQQVVHAGVNSPSYPQASCDLAALSDLTVGPKPVERLVKRIGRERIDGRDAAVAAHARLPRREKDAVADPSRPCPAVAMVSVDGGRLQIRSEPPEAPERHRRRRSRRGPATGGSRQSRSWRRTSAPPMTRTRARTCPAASWT